MHTKNLKSKKESLLKEKLTQFWNSSLEYYKIARAANVNYYDGQHPFHIKMIEAISPNSLVLDLACGTAEPSKYIACHSRYIGVDISQISLKMARQSFPSAFFIRGDVAHLPFKNQIFDYVICLYSLEHFLEPKKALLESIRILKPGGYLFLLSSAFDDPLSVPPSIKFSSLSVPGFRQKFKRGGLVQTLYHYVNHLRYILHQIKKQFKLYCIKHYYEFEIIPNPVVLIEDYEIDNDVVYVVSIREVVKFLRQHGLNIKEVNRNDNIWWSWFRLSEYFTNTLFIVAQKPM